MPGLDFHYRVFGLLYSAVHSDPAGRVISRDAGGQRTEKKQRREKHKREPTGHGALHVQRGEVREEQRSLLWLAEQKRIKVRVAEEQEHLGRMRRRRVQLHICETLVAAGAIIECRERFEHCCCACRVVREVHDAVLERRDALDVHVVHPEPGLFRDGGRAVELAMVARAFEDEIDQLALLQPQMQPIHPVF